MAQSHAPNDAARGALEDPDGVLDEAEKVGGQEWLDRQEEQGQWSMTHGDVLPTAMQADYGHNPRSVLEAAGLEFRDIVEKDPIFRHVTLPKGWSKKASAENSLHSHLLDAKGRKRGLIMYKAASYDRRSYLHLSSRFGVISDHDRHDAEKVCVALVTDTDDTVVHTTEPIPDGGDYTVANAAARNAAFAWLDAQYPEWQDPGAYWD